MQGPELPGTVERQNIVAPLRSGAGAHNVHLLGGAVEPAVHDDGRARAGGEVGAVDIARQCRVLVWDLDRLDWRIEQRRAGLVAVD